MSQISSDHTIFKTKTINYNGIRSILIQNENGPCSLLAITNSLLLTIDEFNHNTELDDLALLVNSSDEVELFQLLNLLKNIILNNQSLTNEEIQYGLSLLPKLNEGLTINPKFDGSFTEDNELIIFKLFGLNLVHGWIISPEDPEFKSVITYNSYEAAQNVLIEAYDLESKSNKDSIDQEIIDSSIQIKHFFARTATQLTDYGLQFLKTKLIESKIYVFFRNDHFNTIIKDGNDIYQLITDSGFANKSQFVWESLLSINGLNNSFFKGNFEPIINDSNPDNVNPFIHEYDNNDINDNNYGINDQDRALALQIQEEEDQRAAQALNKRYNKNNNSNNNRRQTTNGNNQNSNNKSKRDKNGRKDKKSKKCTIM
ncbi:hypothetical protein WICMUC_001282 [Wickerhamomyces mucosus]|uniref:MINDY deubiquitinase domain-containing protein n=1 Tax=Wickerhamomyces mucosus TaxID=1378264 RepID=A0A9P8TI07_9ASCO|nr:hypothetical protein WICMUC_001282 [Wickerhamomyces mucosus]